MGLFLQNDRTCDGNRQANDVYLLFRVICDHNLFCLFVVTFWKFCKKKNCNLQIPFCMQFHAT